MSRAIVSVLSVFALFAAAPGAKAADDEPKDILARAIKAHGGEEFLTKNKAGRTQAKGKITLPGLGEAEFTQTLSYMMPNKFRDSLELNVGGQNVKINTLLNGDDLSIDAAGQKVEITDNIKKAIKESLDMMAMARLTPLVKDKAYELSIFGEVKVEGKPAIGVRAAAKGKKDMTFFFDKKSNLLVKIEHRGTDSTTGAEVNEERIILDYKKNADGIPIPQKVIVKHDGKTFVEAETVEATYLEKIDDSEFKK